MDTRVTSYSDYMRCLAAKYNNNPQSPPPAPASAQPPIPSTLKHELLPLLAAHQSAFPAFSLPGLSLFNPFLSQASETKPPASSGLNTLPREETHERLKRPKDDPLDLTDKKMKKEEPEEAEDRRSVSPSASLNKTPKNQSLLDWTVEEVEEFVSKVDDCGQYAKIFSENLIDGSCLPKLTETHLTTVMGIKLGPAIKLITTIKSLMPSSGGSSSTCVHCNHCHSSSTSPSPS